MAQIIVDPIDWLDYESALRDALLAAGIERAERGPSQLVTWHGGKSVSFEAYDVTADEHGTQTPHFDIWLTDGSASLGIHDGIEAAVKVALRRLIGAPAPDLRRLAA